MGYSDQDVLKADACCFHALGSKQDGGLVHTMMKDGHDRPVISTGCILLPGSQTECQTKTCTVTCTERLL